MQSAFGVEHGEVSKANPFQAMASRSKVKQFNRGYNSGLSGVGKKPKFGAERRKQFFLGRTTGDMARNNLARNPLNRNGTPVNRVPQDRQDVPANFNVNLKANKRQF